jgi:hypothetical protein
MTIMLAVSVKNIRLFLLQHPVGPKLQKSILQKAKDVSHRGVISSCDIEYVMGDLAEKFMGRVETSKHHSAIADKDIKRMTY